MSPLNKYKNINLKLRRECQAPKRCQEVAVTTSLFQSIKMHSGCTGYQVTNHHRSSVPLQSPMFLHPLFIYPPKICAFDGKYIAAVYDNWYICVVQDISIVHDDVHVKFMQRMKAANTLSWPSRDSECNVPFDHILCCVPVPNLMQRSGRQYQLDSETILQIENLFEAFMRRNN